MLQNYNNIIWDWNGTLLDDVELGIEIAQQMCAQHHSNLITKDMYRSAFGFPIPEYYRKMGIDLNRQSFEELTQIFVSTYNAKVQTCGLMKNAPLLLQQFCLLYTSPSPRDLSTSRMPSSA